MKTILIIEDDRWFAEMLRDQLSRHLKVLLASGAQKAMDVIDTVHPDALILDLMLPGANGIALLQELRSHTDLMQLPVIVCSNTKLEVTQKQALQQFNVAAVFDKANLDLQELRAMINELTGVKT